MLVMTLGTIEADYHAQPIMIEETVQSTGKSHCSSDANTYCDVLKPFISGLQTQPEN